MILGKMFSGDGIIIYLGRHVKIMGTHHRASAFYKLRHCPYALL